MMGACSPEDKAGAGKADVIERFGETAQTGGAGGVSIGMYKGSIYAEINDRIVRYTLLADAIVPKDAHLIANTHNTHLVSNSPHRGNAFVAKSKRPLKGVWTEHIGHRGIEKVQGNPAVQEVGKISIESSTIAVTTRRNEWANDGLEWARKSRFGTLPPFNPAFFDERQLAHQTPRGGYAVR